MNSANIALRLSLVASRLPYEIAIATPAGKYQPGRQRAYRTLGFRDLDQSTSSIAAGLQQLGIQPGMRIVLLVRFGADFIALVFALLKAGAVVVLVDPGMGRWNLINCLEQTQPDGFVAIPMAQVIRATLRYRFPKARFNVTVGNRFGFLPAPTLDQLARTPSGAYEPPDIGLDDPAAIIFTTGSTGPPKGVLYTHRTFNSQVDQLVERYGIQPGGRDLSGFPLFGLFNAVMGTTTLIPDMDPTRPADVDPPRLLDAIDQWHIDQAFGSPALWTRVGKYCEQTGRSMRSLKRVLSAGAPVAPHVLKSIRAAIDESGEMFTPYGATEALPIASIESREVLEETSHKTSQGAGTCVGTKFSGIEWRVMAIDDAPLASIEDCRFLEPGEIGELLVSGAVVSREYVTRTDQNALHKVADGDRVWHRMGDVGYLDDRQRFWYCGRKSHRIRAASGTMFTEPCEAIFNSHPHVHRSALVGVRGSAHQQPVLVVEPWSDFRPQDAEARLRLSDELRELGQQHEHTKEIERILIYPKRLPTDIRHNAKIFREKLIPWAEKHSNPPRDS